MGGRRQPPRRPGVTAEKPAWHPRLAPGSAPAPPAPLPGRKPVTPPPETASAPGLGFFGVLRYYQFNLFVFNNLQATCRAARHVPSLPFGVPHWRGLRSPCKFAYHPPAPAVSGHQPPQIPVAQRHRTLASYAVAGKPSPIIIPSRKGRWKSPNKAKPVPPPSLIHDKRLCSSLRLIGPMCPIPPMPAVLSQS